MRDQEAVRRFADRFVGLLVQAGMARMPSRVFVELMCSDDGALTSAELAERLQVSPAAISGAVRYLGDAHLVHREHVPGTRKDRYRMPDGGWYTAFTDRSPMLRQFSAASGVGADTLGEETPAGSRMGEMRDFFDFLLEELGGVMERWAKFRTERAES